MAPDKVVNKRDKLQSQVHLHHVMDAGLPGTLFLGVLLLGFVVVRDTIKIMLPEVKQPHEIGSNYANRDYLLDMAGCVLDTVLAVMPEMADYNDRVTLKMADPDGYAGLKTVLDAVTMRFRQERVTTAWVPRKEGASEQDKRMKVNGKLKTFIIDKFTPEHEKDYLVEFTIITSGRLYVSKIEETVKRDPPTNEPTGNRNERNVSRWGH